MKTIYQYFLLLVLFIGGNLFVSGVYANVDVTNSFGFTYDCTSNWWVLHTTFDLWWHHWYQRDYKIDRPGVIEIKDGNHTTTSKSSNISIDGCNYKPDSCNVSSWSDWVLDSSDNVSKTVNIDTNASVHKSWDSLIINWTWTSNRIKITWFSEVYESTWKNVRLSFLNDKIILEENGSVIEKYTFTNNIYSWMKEYYYEFSSDNKNIELKKNIFKKTWNWTVMSSSNAYDTFSAFRWSNTWCAGSCTYLDSNPNAQWPDYITWLNFWDYTQHYYTTTKVNIYPVSVACSETKYSDWTNYISSDSYPWTLWWIIQPDFSGPIKINWIRQQTSWVTIYASSSAKLEWLRYAHVWEIGWVKVWIDGIEFTIKKSAITLWKQKLSIAKKTTVWEFPALDFNELRDASGKSFALNTANIYWLEIVLYSWTQIVWTYALPITVVPNNDLKIGSINISENNPYANWSDAYVLCSSVVDSFGNPINANYTIDWWISLSSPENFDIDSVTSWFQGEWLRISNPTFLNSQLCFNLRSLSPWKKDVTFKARIPKHEPNGNLDANGEYLDVYFTKTISFRKTFTWALSITTSPYTLSIGTMLTMKLGVTQKSTLSTYSITQFKNQMRLADSTNHEFQNMGDAASLSNNPTIDYRINAATDAGVSTAPGVSISGNPIISYTLDGQVVRYRLSATDSASDTIDLALWWVQMNSLKVVGSLQWQGKQTLVGQSTNFSDISKSDMRTTIRKNAYTLIRWRTSGTIVWGVKYIDGNTTLSWEPDYETLIVKNGNLTISNNFNTSNKKFGVIVLRDSATQTTQGNIYVQPTVRYIRAAIYADGGMISTGFWNDTVGNYQDSPVRTNVLSEQLVIKGTLFTRNTIGGAIKGSTGKYILPGGSLTTDFDQAMMHDLNYMRRNNHGYNITGTNGSADYNQGNQNNVVIIFDSNLQSSPPKGFK